MQYNTRLQPVLFLKIRLVAPHTVSLRLIRDGVLCGRGNDPRTLQCDDKLLDLGRDKRGRSARELLVELLGGKIGKDVGESGGRFRASN